MNSLFGAVVDAFPSSLKVDASTVAMRMTKESATRAVSLLGFKVSVADETVTIPCRLYSEEVSLRSLYSATELAVLDCLQTRHHNGFVRERALRYVLTLNTPWSSPFIVQLIAEYVVEILDLIDSRWTEVDEIVLGRFLLANAGFHSLVRQRVASYWSCYHRSSSRESYVGFRLLRRMDEAVKVVKR